MAAPGKMLVRSKSGLRTVSLEEDVSSPFLLDEPPWIPDNECSSCIQCQKKFDWSCRRHHCRRCGRIFCSSCCDNSAPLPRMSFVDPVRQCADCVLKTKRENDFFEKYVKTLINGATFHVKRMVNNQETLDVSVCKMSADQRYITFEGGNGLEPINLTRLEGVQIITSGADAQGNTVASGISLKFSNRQGDLQKLQLSAPETTNKRPCLLWIAAMQKAVKLLYETRGVSATTPVTP
ncbi:unnamed protein product [Owenia fusiformis]|uniref:Uncharacterized protein n=1 Tax=Owenia fusiformis TaxID=6347 RepID=A0A8J1UJB2_OWEFU|nr:unnamed protein product [Owenia fusiformis]